MSGNHELDLELENYYGQAGAYVSPWLIYGGGVCETDQGEEIGEVSEEQGGEFGIVFSGDTMKG